MSKESRKLFGVVYQWGRVGVVTDEHSPIFRQLISDIDRKTLETVIMLLNGDDNQVEVATNYIWNKLKMYDELDKEISDKQSKTLTQVRAECNNRLEELSHQKGQES